MAQAPNIYKRGGEAVAGTPRFRTEPMVVAFLRTLASLYKRRDSTISYLPSLNAAKLCGRCRSYVLNDSGPMCALLSKYKPCNAANCIQSSRGGILCIFGEQEEIVNPNIGAPQCILSFDMVVRNSKLKCSIYLNLTKGQIERRSNGFIAALFYMLDLRISLDKAKKAGRDPCSSLTRTRVEFHDQAWDSLTRIQA